MIQLTETAVGKVKEILDSQEPKPSGLRISVVGGGCSGFSYSMAFENGAGMMDKVYDFDGLRVFVDATSLMYLNGARVDYVETLEGAGFDVVDLGVDVAVEKFVQSARDHQAIVVALSALLTTTMPAMKSEAVNQPDWTAPYTMNVAVRQPVVPA